MDDTVRKKPIGQLPFASSALVVVTPLVCSLRGAPSDSRREAPPVVEMPAAERATSRDVRPKGVSSLSTASVAYTGVRKSRSKRKYGTARDVVCRMTLSRSPLRREKPDTGK